MLFHLIVLLKCMDPLFGGSALITLIFPLEVSHPRLHPEAVPLAVIKGPSHADRTSVLWPVSRYSLLILRAFNSPTKSRMRVLEHGPIQCTASDIGFEADPASNCWYHPIIYPFNSMFLDYIRWILDLLFAFSLSHFLAALKTKRQMETLQSHTCVL